MVVVSNQVKASHMTDEFVSSVNSTDQIESMFPRLISNQLSTIITDYEKEIQFNQHVTLISLWSKSNELFMNGKRYKLATDMDQFVIDVFKSRSPTCFSSVEANGQPFLFCCEEAEQHSFILNRPVTSKVNYKLKDSIRLSWNFTDPNTLRDKWMHLTEQSSLVVDPEEAHYNVVINASLEPCIDPTRTYYFCMEPHGDTRMFGPYLQQVEKHLKFVGTHDRHLNNVEWHLSPSLKQLKELVITKTKDKVLSVCVSDKAFDPGHKYRLALIKKLDEMSDSERGFDLDIYGKCKSLMFKHYRGELPEQCKDEALFPYKYHFNVENHYMKNYITEKLYDTVCSEALLFYAGAPNVGMFFESPVVLSGDIARIDEDIKIIRTMIQEDEYSKRKPSIMNDKFKVLYSYGFEPRIASIHRLIDTQCFVTCEEVKQHYIKEGLKNVQIIDSSQFFGVAQHAAKHIVPCIYQSSSELYDNLFDRLCFTFAPIWFSEQPGSVDGISLRKEKNASVLDIMLLPSGGEKIANNIKSQKFIFDQVKIGHIM
jgi:hypothetical protein